MDILQAVLQLRPGTSWNLRGDQLEQAEDEAPMVSVPTDSEIKAVMAADPIPDRLIQAKATLKNTNATTDDKVKAIILLLGL